MLGRVRENFKPYEKVWMFQEYKKIQSMFWIPDKVSLATDIDQWRNDLTGHEKHLLTEVSVYLSMADSDVGDHYYLDKIIPAIRLPEARMVLTSIAFFENIHREAYAYTLDSVGIDESAYSRFLEIPEMMEKHEFGTQKRTEDLSDVQRFLLDIAIGSGVMEGIHLFSAFALILSFQRRGLMPGFSTIIRYIFKDEDLHCEVMTRIFREILQEHPSAWTKDLQDHITKAFWKGVDLNSILSTWLLKMSIFLI